MISAQPKLLKIVATRDPSDRAWELPKLRLGEVDAVVVLVGWILDVRPIDAGVPEKVAEILVRTLTTRNALTFLDPTPAGRPPVPEQWSPSPAGWIRGLRPGGLGRFIGAPVFPLICADRPEGASRLFFAEGFSWEQRSQIVALSDARAEPPELPYSLYDLWLRHRRIDERALANRRVEGLMIPGPDGDFAGLFFRTTNVREQVLSELGDECRAESVGFEVVSESAFRSTRWYPPG